MSPRFCGDYCCCLLVLMFRTRHENIWRLPRDRFHLIECHTRYELPHDDRHKNIAPQSSTNPHPLASTPHAEGGQECRDRS